MVYTLEKQKVVIEEDEYLITSEHFLASKIKIMINGRTFEYKVKGIIFQGGL